MLRFAVLACLCIAPCSAPLAQSGAAAPDRLPAAALALLRDRGVSPIRVRTVASLTPRAPWTAAAVLIAGKVETFDPADRVAGTLNILPNGGLSPGPANGAYFGVRFDASAQKHYLLDCPFNSSGRARAVFHRLSDDAIFGDSASDVSGGRVTTVSMKTDFGGPAIVYVGSEQANGLLGGCDLYEISPAP